MKSFFLSGMLILASLAGYGQCSFTATISPGSLILCPNESDTLWSDPADSYQWYRDGVLLNGATGQYIVVGPGQVGYSFTVDATIAGCTETSNAVLVDAWMFLLPAAMTEGTFSIDGMGAAHKCVYDTAYLIAMNPYSVNLQWFENGTPIPGANNDTLVITQSGSYTFEGAPAVCPNYIQNLGVNIDFFVHTPPVPVISATGNTLSVSPAGYDYNWYINGTLIPGSNTETHVAQSNGIYTVELTDNYGCKDTSASYNFTSNSVSENEKQTIRVVDQGEGKFYIEMQISDVQIHVFDLAGKKMGASVVRQNSVDLSQHDSGMYFITLYSEKAGFKKTVKVIRK